jgi:hypothetical protein
MAKSRGAFCRADDCPAGIVSQTLCIDFSDCSRLTGPASHGTRPRFAESILEQALAMNRLTILHGQSVRIRGMLSRKDSLSAHRGGSFLHAG